MTSQKTTTDPQALAELHRFCREGRFFEVQDWIKNGKPLQIARTVQFKGARVHSAMRIAVESGNHSIVRLLCEAGYDPNLDNPFPLDLALKKRRVDLIDLLLAHGADPKRIDMCTLFDTFDGAMYERFYNLGTDLTAGHELAAFLAITPANRPLYGFVKRHRAHDPAIARELQIGLNSAIYEKSQRAVALCLWAGADPRIVAPDLSTAHSVDRDAELPEGERFNRWTALEQAALHGELEVLRKFKPDPKRDDIDSLHDCARESSVVEYLFTIAPPSNPCRWLVQQTFWIDLPLPHPRYPSYVVERAFKSGLRLTAATSQEISDLRRNLLKVPLDEFVSILRTLTTPGNCSDEIIKVLSRTPTFRKRMEDAAILPRPPKKNGKPDDRPSPIGTQQILRRIGVDRPAAKLEGPTCVYIGTEPGGRSVRIDRATLFKMVWDEPIERLAGRLELSGRGLSKGCARVRVPVPPRGYWAKLKNGQPVKRPALPKYDGEDEMAIFIPCIEPAGEPVSSGTQTAPSKA